MLVPVKFRRADDIHTSSRPSLPEVYFVKGQTSDADDDDDIIGASQRNSVPRDLRLINKMVAFAPSTCSVIVDA